MKLINKFLPSSQPVDDDKDQIKTDVVSAIGRYW